jgi:uncharacterized surface protein with fasciclin (FAS1) repeats
MFHSHRTYAAILSTALAISGGATAARGQDKDIDLSQVNIKIKNATPKRNTGKDVVAQLKEAGKYSTFLSLAEQAGLTGILHGTERDSAPAEVTIREGALDKVMAEAQVKVEGEVPPGVDLTAIKSQLMDLVSANIGNALLAADEITVLAPTDAAFAKLPKASLDALKANPDALRKLLRAHIVNKGVLDITHVSGLQNLNGTVLPVETPTAKASTVAGSTVTKEQLLGDNGIAYSIDTVIQK